MEKITVVLKALTHEGFGSPDYYSEKVKVVNCPEAIRQAIIDFALKYGVEIDSVKIMELKTV